MPGRYPAISIAGFLGIGGVEGRLETIPMACGQFDVMNAILQCRQNDLRCKGQRSHYCPGRNRSVIWPIRDSTRNIVKKSALDPIYLHDARARPIARSYSPAAFVITRELERVMHRILLLNISRYGGYSRNNRCLYRACMCPGYYGNRSRYARAGA